METWLTRLLGKHLRSVKNISYVMHKGKCYFNRQDLIRVFDMDAAEVSRFCSFNKVPYIQIGKYRFYSSETWHNIIGDQENVIMPAMIAAEKAVTDSAAFEIPINIMAREGNMTTKGTKSSTGKRDFKNELNDPKIAPIMAELMRNATALRKFGIGVTVRFTN